MGVEEGTVLVVDRPETATTVSQHLSAVLDGIDVETVHHRAAALAAVEAESVLCVVSNFEVPDDDGSHYLRGVDLAETVRERDDELPVVLYTDTGHEDVAKRAIESGATDYAMRCRDAASFEQLATRVEQVVDRRRAELRSAHHARIAEIVRDVNAALVRASSPEAVQREVCAELSAATHYGHVLFATAAADGGIVATSSESDGEAPPSESVTGVVDTVTESGRSVVNNDLSATVSTSLGQWAQRQNYGSFVAVPVVAREESYGVVVVFSPAVGAFDDTEQSVLDELGETIGTSLAAIEAREELARQNERLDEFARTVSHDLRNPLSVITAHANLARTDDDPAHLDAIDDAAERMADLISELLELAYETDADAIRPVSIEVIARQAWESVETDGATLSVEDRTVSADPTRLQQVFENLFRNAVEHGSTGNRTGSGDSVEHDSAGDSGADNSVAIWVERTPDGFAVGDDGPGIPADQRESVFEQGYSTADDGTGYGLAIVRSVVADHDWTVHAKESEQGGARFVVTVDGS